LPEYEHYQLAIDSTILHPAGKPMWHARDGLLEFVGGLDLEGKKGVVLLVPPNESIKIFTPYFRLASAKYLTKETADLYFLPVEAARLRR
jgi:hypothetical protein